MTRGELRKILIARAKDGIYDQRFFAYYHVSPNVNAACRRAARRAYAHGLVPTSTLRFPVGGGSYHQARTAAGEGMAVDFGLVESEIGTAKGRERMLSFQVEEHALYRQGHLRRMVELIGPHNRLVVLRDRETDLAEGSPLETQHDNHVHEAHRE